MTPVIDGKVYHFEELGLYDGLVLLGDKETKSYWHHITGESLYGPLAGKKIPVQNIFHTTVEEALENYPDIHVAISDARMRENLGVLGQLRRGLSRMFRNTMGKADTRRDDMDIGLGIWAGDKARYYPYDEVRASGNVIFDTFEGRGMVVFYAPKALALLAVHTDATSATWVDDELHLNTGQVVRRGILYEPDGPRSEADRPMQVFTRWYGFYLTWPKAEVFERSGV
jgi:hypothetical protein